MTIRANLSVTITVGNDAVQTGDDVAAILRTAADRITDRSISEIDDRSIALLDLNGNRVGTVQVTGFRDDGDGDLFAAGRYVYVQGGARGDDEGLIVSAREHTFVLESFIHHDRIAYERRLATFPLAY